MAFFGQPMVRFTALRFSVFLLIFHFMGSQGLQTYVPFQGTPTDPTPWSPLLIFPLETYWKIRGRQGALLTDGIAAILGEANFRRIFRTTCLLSAHRVGSNFGPSGAWDGIISTGLEGLGIASDLSLFLDDLFLAISRPEPSIEWYTQVYATRDTLFAHWISNPKKHTKGGTLILTIFCNALAIIHIRLLAIRGGPERKNALSLTAALPSAWKEILT